MLIKVSMKNSVLLKMARDLTLGCPKSEKQHLNACDCCHQDGLDRIVDARMRHFQLLGHGHHSGSDHEDLDPREGVLTPLDQSRPRIGEDELPGYAARCFVDL